MEEMSNDFEQEPDSRPWYLNGGKEIVERRTCSIHISELKETLEWENRSILPAYNRHPFKLGKVKFSLFLDEFSGKWNIKLEEPGPRCTNKIIYIGYTRCNYGGLREWFICPRCRDLFGILYRDKDNFRCRRCLNLVYHSQKLNYRSLSPAIKHKHKADAMIDKYHRGINKFYNGKPTRRTVAFEKLKAKSLAGFDYYGEKYLKYNKDN